MNAILPVQSGDEAKGCWFSLEDRNDLPFGGNGLSLVAKGQVSIDRLIEPSLLGESIAGTVQILPRVGHLWWSDRHLWRYGMTTNSCRDSVIIFTLRRFALSLWLCIACIQESTREHRLKRQTVRFEQFIRPRKLGTVGE